MVSNKQLVRCMYLVLFTSYAKKCKFTIVRQVAMDIWVRTIYSRRKRCGVNGVLRGIAFAPGVFFMRVFHAPWFESGILVSGKSSAPGPVPGLSGGVSGVYGVRRRQIVRPLDSTPLLKCNAEDGVQHLITPLRSKQPRVICFVIFNMKYAAYMSSLLK